jgi:maltooligosyltrehalose trehalohydrolase
MLDLYRSLIALRRERPELGDPRLGRFVVRGADDDSWLVLHRGGLRLVCNLGQEPATVPLHGEAGDVLLSWGDATVAGTDANVPPESFALVQVWEK